MILGIGIPPTPKMNTISSFGMIYEFSTRIFRSNYYLSGGNVTEKPNRSVPSVQEAYTNCGAQMCTGTSGNPDLTEIGVRTTLIFYKKSLANH